MRVSYYHIQPNHIMKFQQTLTPLITLKLYGLIIGHMAPSTPPVSRTNMHSPQPKLAKSKKNALSGTEETDVARQLEEEI